MSYYRNPCDRPTCNMNPAVRTDPAILDGVLPRGASLSDIDGFVEINGHFLAIEFKPPGFEFTRDKGQQYMLERLSLVPNFTVMIVGAIGPNVYDARYVFDGEIHQPFQCSTELLRKIVSEWGIEASKRPGYKKGYRR